MDAGLVSLLVLLILVAYLASGTVIFISIFCVSLISLWSFLDFDVMRLGATMARIMIRASSGWELSAIPLFIWMGEIVFRTSMVRRMFEGLTPLVSRLPGGLLHTNVVGCALFAAVSGSSAATTATVGKITLNELKARDADPMLAVGSLAGAGTLGLLIPPSIVLIIYGLLAEVSIVRLFAAGLMPGLMIALIYSLYIAWRSRKNHDRSDLPPLELGRSLLNLWQIFALILVVLGSLYTGWATPTESAAIGVTASLCLAAINRELTLDLLISSIKSAVPVRMKRVPARAPQQLRADS